jgi:hypothetical protein
VALVVEDGTGVEGANSYSELDALRAYAADRGVVLSADDAVLTPMAIKATDYIESFSDQFVGSLTDVDQALSWPRKNVTKEDGSAFPSDEIPVGIMAAQAQLCIEQFNGVVLLPTANASSVGRVITKRKVDSLETDYSDKYGFVSAPLMPAVEALLNKFFSNGGVFFRTVRV